MSHILTLLLIMPVTSALVGWGTNVLAIKMMFYPLQFVGKRPFFGWQGIIPARAEKMATFCVDMMMDRLLNVEELFSKIDPQRVANEMEPVLHEMTEDIIEDVLSASYPKLWESIPKTIKDKTLARVKQELPGVITRMMNDLKHRITELCDVRNMVITAFTKEPQLLNELFLRCGAKEFVFIGRSGIYFGAGFGIILMLISTFFRPWWLLPVAGLLVGYLTNWLALKMIFEPIEPKRFGPWTWQGLFLRRQQEVANEYAALFAKDILTPENIFATILRGPASDQMIHIIQRHLKAAIDDAAGMSKPIVQWAVGTEQYISLKAEICDRMLERIERPFSAIYPYTKETLDIENVLRDKLQALPPAEFEGVLRPIFQEDEWILILVGALLGLLVGIGQVSFLGVG